jgi:3'(2'), 5'-bisphosphate nucleotidase
LTYPNDEETHDRASLHTQNIAQQQAHNNASLLPIALTIVRQAALLARRIQAEMISPDSLRATAISKTDRSPVTVADFAIQALVARRLMEVFPTDPLVAEEDSSALKASPLLELVTEFVSSLEPATTPQAICEWIDRGHADVDGSGAGCRRSSPVKPALARYWLLDPIDGTKGFLRGGQYAVALALMVDGQVQIGVLGCPVLPISMLGKNIKYHQSTGASNGCLVYAARGLGTWVAPLEVSENPTRLSENTIRFGHKNSLQPHPRARLHVSRRSKPAQARLLRSFEAGHTNVDQIEQFATTLGIQAEPVLMDSQVKYAILAAGQGDLMLRLLSTENPNYREKAWDQAAGSLVVEAAGGRATDLDGKPFDFTAGRELIYNRGVLVSNGRLHEASLQALKTID